MPTFVYEAKSLAGGEMRGVREARDKFELARSLRKEGYTLIKAEEERPRFTIRLPLFLGRVSVAEKMLFSRNLAVMIASGLSLARGLEFLSHETKNRRLSQTLAELADAIRKGENFSDALRKHPRIFPEFFRAMIRAGEKTGQLDESLKLLSRQLRREHELRRRIRGAMMYPAIILVAMIAIGILMLVFVVPTLESTFNELDVPLPRSTRFIIAMSTFLSEHPLVVLFALLLFGGAVGIVLNSRMGKKILSAILLKTPVISGLVKKANAARTCRTLASLVAAGVEILEALKITEEVHQNHHYKELLAQARAGVEKGEPISKLFVENPHLYPPLVGEMITVGEETGKLSDMLFRVAVFYEYEVATATRDLSTIIEPALMIIIGMVVGFFAISMLQPLYNIASSF